MKFSGGLPETLCGCGSTLDATAEIRARLPDFLMSLGIKVLLDAPCGDMNWIADLLPGITYVGADRNEENLIAARERNKHVVLHKLDVVTDGLPPADAMLVRDLYQHLPNDLVFAALRNFVASDIKWLLATCHGNAVNRDIRLQGSFRFLNLCVAPFNLPAPRAFITDSGRIIGAWRRDDIARILK